jgi:metallo-beta-lactamase class B
MRRNIFLIGVLILLLQFFLPLPGSADTVNLDEGLTVTRIEDRIYLHTHYFPWPANGLIVLMGDSHLILVDTPYTPEATEVLLRWSSHEFGIMKIIAINTGSHIDNLGGNEYLLSEKIPIYGSCSTPKVLQRTGERTRKKVLDYIKNMDEKKYYNAVKKLKLKGPTNLIKNYEGLKLTYGDDSLEVFYPGPGVMADNLVVYFNVGGKKILFGGSIVRPLENTRLGYTGDANLLEWPKSLERILEKFPDCKIVIPGHGKLGGKRLIKHTIDLLDN